MGLAYWPLCIAASAAADYALIAAPDFLVYAGELDFFRTRSFELTVTSSEAKFVQLEFPGLDGPFLCVYCAAQSEVDGALLSDEAGRALYHAIGFIAVAGEIDTDQTTAILHACVAPMHAVLRDFLTAGSAPAVPRATARAEYPSPAELGE